MGLFYVHYLKEINLRFTLHKAERVTKRKVIEELFAAGRTFSIYPLRLFYLVKEAPGLTGADGDFAPLQFGVGVSKRHFKKAVDRNRVKRLLKETYRVQKETLLSAVQEKNISLRVFVIFTGKDLPVFEGLKGKVAEALVRLEKEVAKIK